MRISVQEASQLLKAGEVIGVPTETVYGLAASLEHPRAISRIFSLKNRPANNPLIIHVSSYQEMLPYMQGVPEGFYRLAQTFWPGPMTLVVPIIEETIPLTVRAGLTTAAFRVPGHSATQELLTMTGPLVMPSANLSGKPSSTCVEHVEEDFGRNFPVLDGGECSRGVESTILYFDESKWKIVRLGALSPEDFAGVLGYVPDVVAKVEGKAPLCPGQLYRHYAPKARLLLGGEMVEGCCVVGFSDRNYPRGCKLYSLGVSNGPSDAAHRLYAVLRQLDADCVEEAWVDMDFPIDGLWLTLRERLQKASSF